MKLRKSKLSTHLRAAVTIATLVGASLGLFINTALLASAIEEIVISSASLEESV